MLLRVAGSLKLGWVTASLLISKLQAGARENVLSRALRDLGLLVKTQFILRWIENPDYRRRIHRQLNKGEASTHCSASYSSLTKGRYSAVKQISRRIRSSA